MFRKMTSTMHVVRALALAITVLSLALAPMPASAQAPAKIVLRVGTGDSGEGLNSHQAIIAAFEKDNPDILVQLEAVAGNDYYTRLLTQVAADAAPDIMQIGDDAVPQFVKAGALIDLDPYIKGEKYPLDMSIYLSSLLTPGQYQGKQYLLPKDYSPLAVYYNKKLFDEAKVAYPKDGWTWDEFLQTAQALTKTDASGKTTQWGIQLPASWTSGFEYWIAAAGGRLISEDGTTFTGYFDSKEVAAAVQFYADLYNKHKVAPPPADFNLFGGGNSEFDNGKAAMRIFGHWPQDGLKKNPNVDLGVVGTPVGAKRANVLFWGGFGISQTSKNQEAAWRLLRYYAGTEGAQVVRGAWGLPAVKAVAEEIGATTDPLDGVWIKELDYLAPRAYTSTDFWGTTADPALNRVLQTVLLDPNADVAAVLKQGAEEAQSKLAEMK